MLLSGFYTSVIYLIWLALGALCLLVYENARIQGRDKRLLYLTYLLIAVSALAEYCGVLFNGRTELPRGALLAVKIMDYILTPLSGCAIILQLRLKNRWNILLCCVIAANTVMQLLNPLTGWMVTVDESHLYHHGPLYPLYFITCIVTIGIVILQFFLYGRSFHRQNRKSLYAILLLVIIGILMQELSNGQVRTSYIALTFGAALIFIHYVEFGAQAMDDDLKRQQIQLDTDALTGVFSRFAYNYALQEFNEAGALPTNLAAFTVDINGLKKVNDTLGHEAGDELICAAAACITSALCSNGRCFRTGGDEFVVLAQMDREKAEAAIDRLQRETELWSGEYASKLSVSTGYALAADNEGISAEKLVVEADKAMYEAKAAYYHQVGRDRRHSR